MEWHLTLSLGRIVLKTSNGKQQTKIVKLAVQKTEINGTDEQFDTHLKFCTQNDNLSHLEIKNFDKFLVTKD